MNRLITFIFTVTLVSLFQTSVQAKHHEDDMMDMDRKGRIFEQLDLNDEQKVKLKEFRQSNKGQHKETRKARRELHEKMKQAFISGASDTEIKSIHEEITASHNQQADKRLEKMIFLKNTLNQDQREKFMETRRHRRGKGRRNRGNRGN